MSTSESVRHYLREWRLAKGLSQPELAARAGTVKSEISRLERGSRKMTLDWLQRLTEALGITREELLTVPPMGFGQVSPPPPVKNGQRFTPVAPRSAQWSEARLGEIGLGVEGNGFQLVTQSGDDWPGLFAPGDLLIIDKRKTSTAAPGLFAIKAGEDVMIRRATTVGTDVQLSAGNPSYPTTVLAGELSVLGRVVGHIRRV